MKWVTRDFVHLDRVACPWLIRRFIDRDAVFVFVPWGEEHKAPADATPFAIPGAEIGPHDAQGTTFSKLLAKHKLEDKALARLSRVIAKGVDYVLHHYRPPSEDTEGQIAVGLLAISEGMMLRHDDDNAIIAASLPVYDALYANFRAHLLMEEQGGKLPPYEGKGPTNPTKYLRGLLRDAGKLP